MSSFCVGLVAGGLVAAAFYLIVGSLLRPVLPVWARLGLIAPFLVFILLREYGHFSHVRMPENRRLVPITVFRFGDVFGPFQFGLEMGTGARTYLPSGLPYVVALAVAFFADIPLAALAGIGFGLGRGYMAVASALYTRDGSQWSDDWDDRHRQLVTTTVVTFTVAACVAIWTTLT
ncbi:hypothetical protein GCM10010124_13180 [Pilimelia terevasa]|uniref:Uncharacterized protein n=1 Tax=Pilimelia terevasa TaxID=53372 RepID=A0A8J3BHQ2_9ACTN|nr:hypothetical protein [Pilimelia terevasa]GGK22059.1 hypothetical protein GCM10010124_13180 [Pilimelia terevasa]